MNETNDARYKLEEIGADIKEYAEIRIGLIKLELAEKTSKTLARVIMFIMMGAFLALFVAFVTLAFALWISQLLGSYVYGFLLVSCVFLFVALIIRLTSAIWLPALRDSFIQSFFEGNENQ